MKLCKETEKLCKEIVYWKLCKETEQETESGR